MKKNQPKKIRVAIVGVGNCASSLVQGIHYYGKLFPKKTVGLMHHTVGPYTVGDIDFSCAFDINKTKVGEDLSKAIFSKPNCAIKVCQVPSLKVPVQRGKTLDGLGVVLKEVVKESAKTPVNVAKILRETKTDIVVNYLPTGSKKATEYYADEAIKAGCGFINCIPTDIATDRSFSEKFKKAGLPLIGDDIKSQVGATLMNRVLLKIIEDRGLKIIKSSQINYGGNTDFLNFVERSNSKKKSKIASLMSILSNPNQNLMLHIGMDFDPTRGDQKWAQIYVEAEGFTGVTTKINLKLEVEDSPNSAGVVVEAIRCMKLALDKKIGGVLLEPSAYLMKHAKKQMVDSQAKEALDRFIVENG